MLTERDIFFSSHPNSLLSLYSPDQLRAWLFPFDDVSEIPTQIWNKYHRIDLIKWDPQPESAFFDFASQQIISLQEFNSNFDTYSLMALQRLQQQLDLALSRWSNQTASIEEFQLLQSRIQNRINTVLQTQAILVDE